MATVKFRLDKPKDGANFKKKEVAIYCRVTVSREQRFEFSTKLRIIPRFWDPILQEAKPNYTGSIAINKTLNKLKGDLLELWNSNKSLTISELRQKSLNYIAFGSDSQPVEKKSNDLELFILDFIKKCEEGKILRKPNTIKAYRSTLKNLHEFSEYSGRPISFEAINLDWYYEFRDWCWDVEDDEATRTKKRKQGIKPKEMLVDSSVGKYIKDIKTFMGEALEAELHSNLSFRKKQFEKLEGDSDACYLSEEEILSIYQHDLSAQPHLIETRDLFVFACWIGLRFSDLSRVKPHHISNNQLKIITKKTGEEVTIPLHIVALDVYRKYNYSLPESDTNAEFNWKLKEIAKAAELETKIQRRSQKRGEVSVSFVDKWTMVTTHTARRSFATNCYKMGVPSRSIMAITGHKTEKAFNKYIRLSKEEHATIMMEHFNKQTLLKVG
jgi:site-specific recombinase XerD